MASTDKSALVLRTVDVTPSELANKLFEDLHCLDDTLLKALEHNKFRTPSPIQWSSLPLAVSLGVDCLLQAKSGTGKTLVFALTALHHLNSSLLSSSSQLSTNSLILAPTREIAVQIASVLHDLSPQALIKVFIGGGVAAVEEDRVKAKQCHIAVGTPGRLRHLIADGLLKVRGVRLFVLDEADRLLDSSFLPDVLTIFNSLPQHKQVIAASATYSEELVELAKRLMRKPVLIRPALESQVLLGVTQVALKVPYSSSSERLKAIKFEALLKLFETLDYSQCLVFCNYVVGAENIANSARDKGWPAQVATGSQQQTLRLKAYNELKNYKCRILVTTDMMARGIDAEHVDLVINFDLPSDSSTYLHRIGRGGRFGTNATAINLVTQPDLEEGGKLANVVRDTGSRVFMVDEPRQLNADTLDAMRTGTSTFEKVTPSSGDALDIRQNDKRGGENGFMKLLKAFDEGTLVNSGTKKKANNKTSKPKSSKKNSGTKKKSTTAINNSLNNADRIKEKIEGDQQSSVTIVKEFLVKSLSDGWNHRIVEQKDQEILESRDDASETKEEAQETSALISSADASVEKAAQIVLDAAEMDFQIKADRARKYLSELTIKEVCKKIMNGEHLSPPENIVADEDHHLENEVKSSNTESKSAEETDESDSDRITSSLPKVERTRNVPGESSKERQSVSQGSKIFTIPQDSQYSSYRLTTVDSSLNVPDLKLPHNPQRLLQGGSNPNWLQQWQGEVEKNKQFIRDIALVTHMREHKL